MIISHFASEDVIDDAQFVSDNGGGLVIDAVLICDRVFKVRIATQKRTLSSTFSGRFPTPIPDGRLRKTREVVLRESRRCHHIAISGRSGLLTPERQFRSSASGRR